MNYPFDPNFTKECFRELERIGALDRPPYRWAKKLRAQICDFIKTCRVD